MAHLILHPGLANLKGCIFPEGSWLARMFCGEFAAEVYEEHQYGEIPKAIPFEPPGTPAMTAEGEAIYTGHEVVDLSQSSLERTQEAWRKYLAEQQASGEWAPEGKLPLTAEEAEKVLKDYGPLLLIGGAVLVVLFLMKR
jgi:hypothetical protein